MLCDECGGGEEEQHRREKDGGVFCGECESAGEARGEEAARGGHFDPTPEGVDGREDGAGGGHVGGDVGSVSEEVGLEAEERECDEAGGEREHLGGAEEDEYGGEQREDGGEEAGAEDERVGVVAAAVSRAVVEEEFAAVEVGFFLEEAMAEGGDFEVEREEWERANHLDHRRVLGVEAEVVGLEALVAGEDVIAFVPGERLAADGVKHLQPEDEDEGGHDDQHPASSQAAFSGEGMAEQA